MFYCWVIKGVSEYKTKGFRITRFDDTACPLIKFLGTKFTLSSYCACGLHSLSVLLFWCRCAWGTHPFPSRTRRLRPKRPMVLHWRRCGRAGGRQTKRKRQGDLLTYIQALESELCKDIAEKAGIWGFPMLTRSAGKCCCDNWFYQWLEFVSDLQILMTDKASVNIVPWKLHTCDLIKKSNILDTNVIKWVEDDRKCTSWIKDSFGRNCVAYTIYFISV